MTEQQEKPIKVQVKSCPFMRAIRGGDEVAYMCSEVDKYCLLETGDQCDRYDEYLKETANEE